MRAESLVLRGAVPAGWYRIALRCACQKAHWKSHKKACKNPMRSKDWQPDWVVENRLPVFLGGKVLQDERDKKGDLDHGCPLWGNTPSFDVVNLLANEGDRSVDLNLAFPASGDLRHVLKTINSLPSDYSGKLTVLINDGTMAISCRNYLILLLLGTIDDEATAADIALHFWYSMFMPPDYKHQVWLASEKYIDHCVEYLAPQPPLKLGPRSDIAMPCIPGVQKTMEHVAASSMTPKAAKEEYFQMRNRKSKQDYASRMYYSLKPSHRVAFQEYRRTGVVLLFGANLEKFTATNQSLFMPSGRWFQTELADPLYGWNIAEVTACGKTHGATPEDLYGCLYFYLSDQLRSFHQRLRKFPISFKVTTADARQLAHATWDGALAAYGLPPSIRFDRVFVSNILDKIYVGLQATLECWAPLLSKSASAAVVGYFMNWFTLVPDGLPQGAEWNAICRQLGIAKNEPAAYSEKNVWFAKMDETDMLYENSGPFTRYLRSQGLDGVLRKTGLRLRKKNTIVPQRFGTKLGAPANALPAFEDEEERYLILRATAATWKERFVEFCRK
ncbi:hypothetical protein NMY22_g17377 [Coprinellus aureogranulatus]|nr:hypothetical protein NMY22_g17377 [Coprinellus aureogranulatus]